MQAKEDAKSQERQSHGDRSGLGESRLAGHYTKSIATCLIPHGPRQVCVALATAIWGAMIGSARFPHWNERRCPKLVCMNVTSKMIGKELRRIFSGLRRPMGWSLIDAFTRLEEREESRKEGADQIETDGSPPKPKRPGELR